MRGSFPLNGTYFQVNEVNIVSICIIFFASTVVEPTLGPSDLSVVQMSLCRYLLTITQAKIQLMFHEVGYGISRDERFTLEPQFLQYLEVCINDLLFFPKVCSLMLVMRFNIKPYNLKMENKIHQVYFRDKASTHHNLWQKHTLVKYPSWCKQAEKYSQQDLWRTKYINGCLVVYVVCFVGHVFFFIGLTMYYMFLQTGLTTEEIQQCFWRGTNFISLYDVFIQWRNSVEFTYIICLQESWYHHHSYENVISIVERQAT